MDDSHKTKTQPIAEQSSLKGRLKKMQSKAQRWDGPGVSPPALENRALFLQLINQSIDLIFIIETENAQILWANDAACEKLGYTRDELCELLVTDIETRFERWDDWREHSEEVRFSETHITGQHRCKDGSTYPVEAVISLSEFDGKSYTLAVVRDMSERVLIEDELRQAVESYRGLFNNPMEAIYIQDSQGRFLSVNQGAEKMYGYPRGFFIGKTPEVISAPGKNNLEEITVMIQKAFEGKPQSFEFWGRRKNGQVFPKDVQLVKGSYYGQDVIFAFARDISKQVQKEQDLRDSEAKFRNIIEQSPIGIMLADENGDIVGWNQAQEMVSGIPKDEIIGKPIWEVKSRVSAREKMTPEDKQQLERSVMGLYQDDESDFFNKEHVVEFRRKDGLIGFGKVVTFPIQTKTGTMMAAFTEDITEKVKSEIAVNRYQGELETMTQINQELIATTDLRQVLTAILRHAISTAGADAGALFFFQAGGLPDLAACQGIPDDARDELLEICRSAIGSLIGDLIENTQPAFIPPETCRKYPCFPVLEGLGLKSAYTVPILRGDQSIGQILLWYSQQAEIGRQAVSFLQALTQQSVNAIENARLFEETQRMAMTDSLTGLYNRRHLFELAEHEFRRARRKLSPLAAIMLDLDLFKRINDNYGHAVGDRALHEAAQIMLDNIRSIDIIGRYGGEEFLILMPDTDQETAIKIAERLRLRMETSHLTAVPDNFTLTLSLGVAELRHDIENLDELVRRADSALYRAKAMGRNMVAVF